MYSIKVLFDQHNPAWSELFTPRPIPQLMIYRYLACTLTLHHVYVYYRVSNRLVSIKKLTGEKQYSTSMM